MYKIETDDEKKEVETLVESKDFIGMFGEMYEGRNFTDEELILRNSALRYIGIPGYRVYFNEKEKFFEVDRKGLGPELSSLIDKFIEESQKIGINRLTRGKLPGLFERYKREVSFLMQ